MARRFVSALILLAAGLPTTAATFFGLLTPTVDAYYCDKNNGSDSNAGTSTAPFQTIAHMTTVDAGANKSRWRLVTGSTWREELTVPRAGMTIDTYGSGAAPLLDCSDAISAGAWSKTGGQTVTYQATLTVPSNDVPSDPDWYTSVWENGTRYTIAHSIASVDATASSYYPVSVNSTTITLYVHTSDGSNPGSDGFTMEYAARSTGVNAQNIANITISGFRTRRNIDANGSVILGLDSRSYNITAEEGNKHNFFCDAGCYVNGLQLKGSYYADLGSSMFIAFGDPDLTRGFDIFNSSAVNMGLSDSAPPGFYVHSSILGASYAYVNFQSDSGCLAFSAVVSAYIGSSTSTCAIHAFDAAKLSVSNTAITFSGSDGTGIACPNTRCDMTVNGASTVITGPSRSGSPGTTCIALQSNGDTLTATDLTCQTASQFVSIVGNSSTVTVGGSGHGATIDVFHYGYSASTYNPVISSDYNTLISPNTGEFASFSGIDRTLTQWRTAPISQDVHSTIQ